MIDCLLMFDTPMLLNIDPISVDLRWCTIHDKSSFFFEIVFNIIFYWT